MWLGSSQHIFEGEKRRKARISSTFWTFAYFVYNATNDRLEFMKMTEFCINWIYRPNYFLKESIHTFAFIRLKFNNFFRGKEQTNTSENDWLNFLSHPSHNKHADNRIKVFYQITYLRININKIFKFCQSLITSQLLVSLNVVKAVFVISHPQHSRGNGLENGCRLKKFRFDRRYSNDFCAET